MSRKISRIMLGFTAAASLLFSTQTMASAAEFPRRNITITVPSNPGGGADLVTRNFASHFEKQVKVPVVVSNKGGGGGTIASSAVAHARPDGYNLLLAVAGPVLLQPLYGGTDYTTKDLRPVCNLIRVPVMLTVNKQSGIKDLKGFIEHAKKNPGELKFSVADAKSLVHLALEDFAKQADISLKPMPQKGANPAVVACLGGHVQAFVGHPSEIMPHAKNGDFIPLATFSDERLPETPDVPTFKELGYNISLSILRGIAVPKDTPEAVVQFLAEKAAKTVEDPAYLADLAKIGEPSFFRGPAETAKMWDELSKHCETLLKSLGLYMQNK